MNKYKYLAKNTIVFFIGSFTSKILVFLLLPLYTTVLTTSEYAISDLMTTSVNLLYMILTMMISEAVLRFSIDKNYDKSEVLSIGTVFIAISSLILGCSVIIASKINLIELFDGYWMHFFLLYFFYSLNHLFAGFIRGLEKVRLIAITGVIGTIVTVVSNILLLVIFKYGISGYLASMILSNAFICFVYLIFGKVYKYISIKSFDSSLMLEMIRYSSPIIITQVAWWINSATDRYMVTWLLGVSETGLLSVAHRLPSVLTIFTSIFMQAWKLSAIKEYHSESSQLFFSKMLNLYNALLIIAGAIVIAFIKPISSIIFRGDFVSAWYLVPPFILAFVINSISAFLGTFYIANRNTKALMNSTLVGALLNIVLNFVLIKQVGAIGPGIATVISYFVISIIRTVQVKQQMKLQIEFKRIILSYILLILLSIAVSLDIKNVVAISSILVTLIAILNIKYIKKLKNVGLTFARKIWRR